MGAFGPHKTDTTDAAWDDGLMRKRTRSGESEDYYRQIFAWRDPDKTQDTLDAHSFTHHMVSADGDPGAANMTACRTGIGTLNGGRIEPGDDTPWMADREGIWNHVAAHMRDAGLEPPELKPHGQQGEARVIELPVGFAQFEHRVYAHKRNRSPWYRVQNVVQGKSADLIIDGEIVSPEESEFLGLGISSASLMRELRDLRGTPLTVWINSPGGLVTGGIGIYNALRMHDAPVTTVIYGSADSIASVIAMGGKTVIMAPHTSMTIHEAFGMTMGNAADHEKMAEFLNAISQQIADVYAERGDSQVNWRTKMQAESYITAEEAVRLKLADRIDTKIAVPEPGATSEEPEVQANDQEPALMTAKARIALLKERLALT